MGIGKRIFIVACGWTLYFTPIFYVHASITLPEAYQAALTNTEVLPIAEAKINQARAKKNAAYANFLPEISFEANRTDEDTKSRQSYTRAKISQEFFSGLEDIFTVQQQSANLSAQESNLKYSKQTTYSQVAEVFYAVLASQKETENIQKIIELAKDRIKEIRNRTKIGRSRNIELLAAQAQLSTLEASAKAAEGQLKIAQDQFMVITGIKDKISLQETNENFRKLAPLDKYLNQLNHRSDIISQQQLLEASEYALRAARADFFPTLSADGHYYFARTGSQAADEWDISITAAITIFSGGSTYFKVKEASAQSSELEISLAQKRRQVENEIRTAYNNLQSLLNQVKAFETALVINEKNYREQEKNYGYGQATNLDVIQALNSYQDTKRNLDHIRYQAMLAWELLKAVTAQFG